MSQSQLIMGTGILLVGIVSDLRTRRFPNWLFLVCLTLGLASAVIWGGLPALIPSLLGGLSGFAAMLPLFLLRIVGGGDLKLMVAFGTASTWEAVISIVVFSLVWGAVFGLARAIGNGQALALARNLKHLVLVRKSEGLELNHLPYTIALFMGWVSYLTVGSAL